MTSSRSGRPRYDQQRPRRIPPHATLRALRLTARLTIDELIERIAPHLADDEEPPARGTISAIESGTRGASDRMIELIEAAYGLPAGSIVTDYVPRAREAIPA